MTERWYLEKLEHLKRADLLLSISASSGREAVERLGFDEHRVVNISTACEPHFQPHSVTAEMRRRLQSAYGIDRPFVMYTGGIDHRKNIEGLIRAYARLPAVLRSAHQLVIVCAAQAPDRERLLQLAGAAGLAQGDLMMTGYVPDDDLVTLYNACKLFVFPSWHEGFGLPALEAMQCGKAVIAANTSSLPEVVGRADALFDPHDEADIAAKLSMVLQDDDLRQEMERHGLEQARLFSWDASARRALEAMERLHTDHQRSIAQARLPQPPPVNRPLLAYVSSLPPEKSGIADYSAELLRELIRWYEVEVVVNQPAVADDWIVKNCAVRDVAWFRSHHRRYERVLYHFGNSPFHQHMFGLLEAIPGVVVLHDFFLSHIQAHREVMGWAPQAWAQALQAGHGYKALLKHYTASDTADVVWAYPCNLPVLQQALGVIVHSEFSRTLAKAWYGKEAASGWQVIPHLRTPAGAVSRQAARQALGFDPDDFLICSFGLLGPTKLNQRLFDAYALSPLAQDPAARLVFVGENDDGAYGQQLLDSIRASGLEHWVRISGWTDAETFRQHLAAADVGVQLRTHSRGETSGTVLDCMNHGLPTVVNAHGSMAELDPDAVWLLPDAFGDADLAEALTSLRRDAGRREALGRRAQAIIRTRHAPAACAAQYAEAIEHVYGDARHGVLGLLHRWADQPPAGMDEGQLAQTLALNFPPAPRRRQLLVDVSELAQIDVGTGIQRVTRAILREGLFNPPAGWSVEPVYATSDAPGYRYARRFAIRFMGIRKDWAQDAPMDAWAGDVFVGLDLAPHLVPQQEPFLADLRRRGVALQFVVYDLLPVLRPDWFPDDLPSLFSPWLRTIARVADGLVCISRATLDDLRNWLDAEQPQRQRPLRLGYFHLGADVDSSCPSTGLPGDAAQTLRRLQSGPTFLMVSTVEPRKGYAQTLAAFEQLWAEGHDVNLAIVGKQGWMVEALVERLRQHTEAGRRLFWLQGISDEYLERIYAASTCLIAASEGEGFGLPLIEAARHRLSIIARDLPVFREVAGDHAFYFSADWPEELAEAIQQWLALHAEGRAPKPDGLPWLTWQQSAKTLETMLMDESHPQWTHVWEPGRRWCLRASDPRFQSQVGKRTPEAVQSQAVAGICSHESQKLIPESTKNIKIGDATYTVASDDIYLHAVGNDFEPHMVQLFRALMIPSDVVADIGANIGLTAILFSSLAKKIYAFEPSPSTCRILSSNLARANASNVKAINLGLGHKEETLTITFAQNNRSGGYVSDKIRPGTGHVTEEIRIDTLDHFFADKEPPTFLKIDVEGFEQNVIKGGGVFLQQHKPKVVMEMNHFCLDVLQRITVPDFLDFMRSVFPYLYAVDTDNSAIVDLHVHDQAYMVMHEHVVRHRFPNLVGGFDPRIKSKLDELARSKSD
jgi:FkbM family methyltransferase